MRAKITSYMSGPALKLLKILIVFLRIETIISQLLILRGWRMFFRRFMMNLIPSRFIRMKVLSSLIPCPNTLISRKG